MDSLFVDLKQLVHVEAAARVLFLFHERSAGQHVDAGSLQLSLDDLAVRRQVNEVISEFRRVVEPRGQGCSSRRTLGLDDPTDHQVLSLLHQLTHERFVIRVVSPHLVGLIKLKKGGRRHHFERDVHELVVRDHKGPADVDFRLLLVHKRFHHGVQLFPVADPHGEQEVVGDLPGWRQDQNDLVVGSGPVPRKDVVLLLHQGRVVNHLVESISFHRGSHGVGSPHAKCSESGVRVHLTCFVRRVHSENLGGHVVRILDEAGVFVDVATISVKETLQCGEVVGANRTKHPRHHLGFGYLALAQDVGGRVTDLLPHLSGCRQKDGHVHASALHSQWVHRQRVFLNAPDVVVDAVR